MKKLLLSLFVAGALTFGLQSCGEDKCEDCTSTQTCVDDVCVENDPCADVTCAAGETCVNGTCETNAATCEPCGDYENTATGNVTIPSIIDTSFSAPDSTLNLPAVFSEDNGTYTLAVDLSGLSALLTDPVEVEGTFDASTNILTVEDFIYTYLGIGILVNGTADFSTTNEVDGNLLLTSPTNGTLQGIDGDIDFTGTKQ